MPEKLEYYNQKKPTSSRKKKRTCIMCRKEFMSDWAGHRFCKECKGTGTYKVGHDSYRVLKR